MNSLVYKTGRFFYKKFPSLQPVIRSAYIRFFAKLNFIGWGMSTEHEAPWEDDYDWESFRNACVEVKQNFELTLSAPSSPVNIDDLKWRHWVISYATRKALKFCKADEYNFVECGVGDGLTSFFVLRETKAQEKLHKCTMHLYDSWEAMEKERLVEAEHSYAGKYHDLNLARTQRNLKEFKNHLKFHVGYIPDSFEIDPPETIFFLHIDLNSSKPTLATLEFFFPRLVNNGIILLDDYGDFNHRETKKLVDKFFNGKPGVLEKLPTGQAIYYHIR